MRAIIFTTVCAQLYDQAPNGETGESESPEYYYYEGPRKFTVTPLVNLKTARRGADAEAPTIRPREFAIGSRTSGRDLELSSAFDSSEEIAKPKQSREPPIVSPEEGLEVLHKLIMDGVSHMDKFGRVILEDFIATRKSSPLHAVAAGPFSTSEMTFQQAPSPNDYWSAPNVALDSNSGIWPWWRSVTMMNDAMTRSSVDLMNFLGTRRQYSIDSSSELFREQAAVLHYFVELSQRVREALNRVHRLMISGALAAAGGSNSGLMTSSEPANSAELLTEVFASATDLREHQQRESLTAPADENENAALFEPDETGAPGTGVVTPSLPANVMAAYARRGASLGTDSAAIPAIEFLPLELGASFSKQL